MALWSRRRKVHPIPTFGGADNTSLESFILSYAADYKKWNDYCFRVGEGCKGQSTAERLKMTEGFSRLYRHFLTPYLAGGVELQLIAYGSTSSFDPERLTISEIKQDGDQRRVFFSIAHKHLDQSDDYFAEISSNGENGWQLHQVFYIDPFPEDGKEIWASL